MNSEQAKKAAALTVDAIRIQTNRSAAAVSTEENLAPPPGTARPAGLVRSMVWRLYRNRVVGLHRAPAAATCRAAKMNVRAAQPGARKSGARN